MKNFLYRHLVAIILILSIILTVTMLYFAFRGIKYAREYGLEKVIGDVWMGEDHSSNL
jgi:hypothetical protein